MDLMITAEVTPLDTKGDMDAVAERVANFNNGWYGGLTFERADDGPIWRLKIYRDGYPDILANLNGVIVTDPSFITFYPSVDQYNSAHPDSPITDGS